MFENLIESKPKRAKTTKQVVMSGVLHVVLGYLAIIGIRTILQEAPQIAGRSNLPVPIAFRRALVTNLLNPKSALFFLAFLPQFVRPARGHVFLQFVLLGMTVSMVGIIFGSTFAIGAGAVAGWLRRHPSFARQQQREQR